MKRFKFPSPRSQVCILSPEPQDFAGAKSRLADFLGNAFPRGLAMFLGFIISVRLA